MSGHVLRIEPWLFVWHGGRLMDVFHERHPDRAVATLQPGPFDWQADRSLADVESMAQAAAEWVVEDAGACLDNVVRYL